MFEPSYPGAVVSPVSRVNRCDRWLIYHRLQELRIPCWCPEDGSLWVEIQNGCDAILLRTIVRQFISSRQDLLSWLERCWETSISPPSNP